MFSYDAGAPGRRTSTEYENRGGELVQREYECAGRMGRFSRTTTNLLGRKFVQDQRFNDIGLPESTYYPSSADDLEPGRVVQNLMARYSRDFLETLGSLELNLLTDVDYDSSGQAERQDLWVPPGYPALWTERWYYAHGRTLGDNIGGTKDTGSLDAVLNSTTAA